MTVDLNHDECMFLSMAMVEAMAQADAQSDDPDSAGLKQVFAGIKAKMDAALVAEYMAHK